VNDITRVGRRILLGMVLKRKRFQRFRCRVISDNTCNSLSPFGPVFRILLMATVSVFLWSISSRADFEGAWEAYERGQYNIAVREFLRCAERGHDKCQLYLGDIYNYGHGTVVRKDKAFDWYARSAKQKNAVAAVRLSFWYLHNGAGAEGRIKSYMWFKIARVLGQELSLRKEARLERTMTQGEILEAQRLATEWWMRNQ